MRIFLLVILLFSSIAHASESINTDIYTYIPTCQCPYCQQERNKIVKEKPLIKIALENCRKRRLSNPKKDKQ